MVLKGVEPTVFVALSDLNLSMGVVLFAMDTDPIG